MNNLAQCSGVFMGSGRTEEPFLSVGTMLEGIQSHFFCRHFVLPLPLLCCAQFCWAHSVQMRNFKIWCIYFRKICCSFYIDAFVWQIEKVLTQRKPLVIMVFLNYPPREKAQIYSSSGKKRANLLKLHLSYYCIRLHYKWNWNYEIMKLTAG